MSKQFLIKKSKSFSAFNKFAIDFILYHNNLSTNNNEYINNPTCSNEKKKIKIGNYEIGQEIGSGAFGKVLLAKHIETQETVAIKILDKEILSQTPEDLELVQQEINILKIVKHKYIAQLYEILETSNYYFIVMEYCEGKDLMDYILKRTRLNEFEALKIFQQLINVLLYLHSQNIVHRDVKIDNMLLDRNNNLKLVDFGLSTKYYDNELLTQPCGTVVYAAPEVLVGHQYHGMLADVWSSGIALFGMLCGFLPFCDQNDEINKQNILNGKVYLPNFLSPSVKDLLMHMLDVNPMNRYTLQEIRDHEWFNQLEVNMIPGIIIGYNKIPIDKNILKICEKFGKNKDVIEKSVKENKCDEYNALYYLLVKKLNKEGVESISDFSSKMFIDFIMNDSNVIREDDNNFNENNFDEREENEKKNCFGMIYNNNNNVKENLNKNFTLMSNYSGNDLSTRDSNKFIILNKVIGNNNYNNNVLNNNINNDNNINKKEINNENINNNTNEKNINQNNKNEINKIEINSKKTNSNNSNNYNENKNIKIKQFNNNNKNILVTKNDKINNKKNEKLSSKIKQIEIKNDNNSNNKTLFKKNKPMIKEKKKKQITGYISKSIEHKDLNKNKYELLEIQNKLQEMYKKKKNNIKKYSKINSVLFSSLNNNNNNNHNHNNNFNKKNLSLNSSKKNSLFNSKEKDKNLHNNKKNNKDNSISPINKTSKKFYSQKEIIEISNRLYTSNIGNNNNKNNNNNNIILPKNKSFNELNNNNKKNNNNNKNKFEKISPFKKSHKLLHSDINNFNLRNNYSLIILSERNNKRNKKNNNNKNKSILNQSMDEKKKNLNKYSNIINNNNNISNNDLNNKKKKIEILNKSISIMKQKLLENKINNNNNKKIMKFYKLNDKIMKSNNKVLSKSILLDNKNNNVKKKFSSSNSQTKIINDKYSYENNNLINENNNNSNKSYLIKVKKFKNSRKENNNSNITNNSKNENSSSFNNSLNKYNNNYSQYITNNYSRIYNYNNNNSNNHNYNGKSIIIRNRLKPFKKTDDSFDYLSINLNNSFVNSSILNNNSNNYSFNNNNNVNNEFYIPLYNNGPIDLSCIYFGNIKYIIKNLNEKMKKKNFFSIQNKSNKFHFSKKDIYFDLEIYKLHNNNVFYFKILKKKGSFCCNLSQILN